MNFTFDDNIVENNNQIYNNDVGIHSFKKDPWKTYQALINMSNRCVLKESDFEKINELKNVKGCGILLSSIVKSLTSSPKGIFYNNRIWEYQSFFFDIEKRRDLAEYEKCLVKDYDVFFKKNEMRVLYDIFKSYEAQGLCILHSVKRNVFKMGFWEEDFLIQYIEKNTGLQRFDNMCMSITKKCPGWSFDDVKFVIQKYADFEKNYYRIGKNVFCDTIKNGLFFPSIVDVKTEQIVAGIIFHIENKVAHFKVGFCTSEYSHKQRIHIVKIHSVRDFPNKMGGESLSEVFGKEKHYSVWAMDYHYGVGNVFDTGIINISFPKISYLNLNKEIDESNLFKSVLLCNSKHIANNDDDIEDNDDDLDKIIVNAGYKLHVAKPEYPVKLANKIFKNTENRPSIFHGKRIIKELDPEIRKMTFWNRRATLGFYNWLATDEKGWRAQAVKAYPVFCHLMYSEHETAGTLTQKINNGVSYVPELAEKLNISERNLKDFYGRYAQYYPFWSDDLGPKTGIFRFMQIKIPTDKKNLAMVFGFIQQMLDKTKSFYMSEVLTAYYFSDVLDFAEKADKSKLIHFWDFYHEIFSNIKIAFGNEEIQKKMKKLSNEHWGHSFFNYRGFELEDLFIFSMLHSYMRIFKGSLTSNDTVGQRTTAVERLLERNTNPSWVALSHDYEHELGKITFLTNSTSLKNEGNLMSHCVGGYTNNCYSGYSHIAHINLKEQEYTEGSTVEFSVDKIGKEINDVKYELRIVQHMKYCDVRASGDLEKIAKSFLNDVNSGVIKIDFIELEKHRCNRKRNKLDKNYKPVKNAAANAVFDIYKDFMPRKFRDKNIFEAIEHHTKDFLKLLDTFKDMDKT